MTLALALQSGELNSKMDNFTTEKIGVCVLGSGVVCVPGKQSGRVTEGILGKQYFEAVTFGGSDNHRRGREGP